MANEEHLKILQQGVRVWNEWREANPAVMPDLVGASLAGKDFSEANFQAAQFCYTDLTRTDLSFADFRLADLIGANLTGSFLKRVNLGQASLDSASLVEAKLYEAELVGAYLPGANLRRAHLNSADLHFADLSGADLTGAALDGAHFDSANLENADLTQATVGFTLFLNIDLSSVKGMDTIFHRAPSSVGLETIYFSKGNIPKNFLRGAGVPETFIEYINSLVGSAFEYDSCFVSYSSKDQKFASRLHADLQDNGVRCWFAPHDVQAGKKLHEQIDQAIRVHERLLLILSPDSIKSEWVKTEIAKARKREITEGRRVLFPIRLNISYEELQEWECFDADRGKDSAREIREYYIPDFTQWKEHDQYQAEFGKLLRDLKKNTAIRQTA